MAVQSGDLTGNQLGATTTVALVVNVRSRSGARAAQTARPELERLGLSVKQDSRVRSGPDLMGAVRQAIASGIGTIVVGGGDGTLSGVVDLLANQPHLTLGLLPVGTGNEVARALGIPLDLPGACRVIAEGHTADVDLAEANGNFFLHSGIVGYPARANQEVPSWLKARFGRLAYAHVLANALLHLRPFRAKVTGKEERWEGTTPLLMIGNSRFHKPARILLPPPQWRERGLIVYGPRGGDWWTLLRLAFGLWVTHRPQRSLLFAITSPQVTIETEPAQPTDLDGEASRPTPLSVRLVPHSLRVLVPRGAPSGG